MSLADPARSRALLIGTAVYEDSALPALDAVTNNVTDLAEVLTSPWSLGLPPGHCTVLHDPGAVMDVGEQLERAAEQAEDLLLVYFAGHGLVDERGELHLGLRTTRSGRLKWSGLPFAHIRECIAGSPARNRVLILDCCFSGRAIEAMGDPVSLASAQVEIVGTYTLTSTSATAPSHTAVGARHTTFTGALLELLRSGLPGGPELLTFRVIYEHLLRTLVANGKPRPEQRGTLTTDQLALVRNRAPRLPAVPADDGVPVPSPSPSDARKTVEFGRNDLEESVRRRKALTVVLAALLLAGLACATVLLKWDWQAVAATAGLAFFPVLILYFWAWDRRAYMVLTRSTLSFTDGFGRKVDIPWPDVDFVGLLHTFDAVVGEDITTYKNLLVVRLGPVSHDYGLSKLTWTVPYLRGFGYHALCGLGDLSADPVLLRDSIIELAGPRYRTNDELLNLDPRLS